MARELLVSRQAGRYWAAVREAGQMVELRAEGTDVGSAVGRICSARVSQVLPGIQSAFLDIGGERSAFIQNSDLLLPGDPPRRKRRLGQDRTESPPPIEDRLKPGRDVLVQIARESRGAKGDRATSLISIAGRFLVLSTGISEPGVSRRIRDSSERDRLLAILNQLGPQVFIARTVALDQTAEQLAAEADRLSARWRTVQAGAAESGIPRVLSEEPVLPLRLLRDAPVGGFDRVVVDHESDRIEATRFLEQFDPSCRTRVEIAADGASLFEAEDLGRAFRRALRPRVWLRSGGRLVIEETEALVSIDVNTAKSIRGNNQAETNLRTNLEAAGEIARQLRLRNLGGLVVVDFIDMLEPDHRDQVVAALELALRDDPARTRLGGLGELGLLELTRKRTHATLSATLTVACSDCSGHGRILDPEAQQAMRAAEKTVDPRQHD